MFLLMTATREALQTIDYWDIKCEYFTSLDVLINCATISKFYVPKPVLWGRSDVDLWPTNSNELPVTPNGRLSENPHYKNGFKVTNIKKKNVHPWRFGDNLWTYYMNSISSCVDEQISANT